MLKFRLLLLLLLCTPIQITYSQGGPILTREDVVRFAVIGDYGDNSTRAAEVADLVKQLDPAFIITTGDNNYPDGKWGTIDKNIGQYYSDYIAPYLGEYGEDDGLENRFFPALGNHDWATGDARALADYLSLPGNERYYEFNWGAVRLFALDNDPNEPDGIDVDSIQASWLQEGLAATSEPWRVVYMHFPPYASSEGYADDVARWPYVEWGADAVIAGHSHVYERLTIDGIPYIINGLGGAEVNGFNEPVAGSDFRFNAAHGAMLVEVTEDNMTSNFHGIYGRPVAWINEAPVRGDWLELDVTSAIQDAGIYTLVLDSTYTNNIGFASQDSGENAPQLVLQSSISNGFRIVNVTQDVSINRRTPTNNAGRGAILWTMRTISDHHRIYLQFEIADLDMPIEAATLRLYTTDAEEAQGGLAVYVADNYLADTNTIWSQDTMTWDNAPALLIDSTPIDTLTISRQ